jgi:hypothetical protein
VTLKLGLYIEGVCNWEKQVLCTYITIYREREERNCIVENTSLEIEQGLGETLNRGFAPYVAKRKILTTY